MNKKELINVYIDGANLHKGICDLNWALDYKKFRVWLSKKYNATRVYLFIGLVPRNKRLYAELQEYGYILIFKETICDGKGNIKGNCDADLVLHMVKDCYEKEFDQSIIVTGDGDYAGLIQFLFEKNKLMAVLAPNNKK